MYLLAVISFVIFIIIFSVVMCIKVFTYKRQIRDITSQIREFKERKTNKKIHTQIKDRDIEDLAFEFNEYLELYKRNEQEKIIFENTLKQGIANMSHDLRTPLTSIVGYLKLIENNKIDKKEAMDILKNKANKLNVLINDFFELASIESEEYELEMTKVNLTNIVQDEILSLYEAFQRKGFEPKITILDKPIFVMGDRDSLERIIDNLLSNTLKYAEGDIQISLEEYDDEAVLKISNICNSIDEKDVTHMFDRFYMADKVRKGEGKGLGLSIAKTLIDKMGGSIISKFEQNRVFVTCKLKKFKN